MRLLACLWALCLVLNGVTALIYILDGAYYGTVVPLLGIIVSAAAIWWLTA